jgi:hypothetical protein
VEAVKQLKDENRKQKERLEMQRIEFQKQQAEIEELRLILLCHINAAARRAEQGT